jgi:hypothetical protein
MRNKLAAQATILILGLPPLVHAQSNSPECQPGYTGSKLCNAFGDGNITNIPELIGEVFVFLAAMVGTLALVMVLYGGAQMIFSQGDPGAVGKAKKTITWALIGVFMIVMAYTLVSATQYLIGANPLDPGETNGEFFINPISSPNLQAFLVTTIQRLLSLLGIIAVVYIIISGFRYMTSAGNENQMKAAKATITWALVGLISVILSYVIVTTIINMLTSLP